MFKVIDLGEEEKLSQVGDRSETLGISDSGWRTLYKLAGVAILLAVVIFRRNCAAEFDLFRGFGIFNVPEVIPVRSMDWFKLLQEDPFVGLVLLDVIDLVNYAIVGLTFLALYGALRGTRGIATKVATIFGLVGITVYFTSNQALAMLSLSEKYAAAVSAAEQDLFLAAGEALLAMNQGTGYYVSLFLVLLAGLIISIVMLQSDVFNRATGILGILANGIALGFFIVLAFAPSIVWLPPTLSAPFRLIWYILIALRFFRLGKITN
jgi:hypothetical protein